MPGPVAVEIVASPAPAPELAEVLLASCSAAAGSAGCVLVPAGGASDVRRRAVVRFSPGFGAAHVQSRSASRDLRFQDRDPPEERFRAAGLVAAALVEGAATSPAAGPDSAPAARAKDDGPAEAPAEPHMDAGDAETVAPGEAPSAPGAEALDAPPIAARAWAAGIVGLDARPRAGVAFGADLQAAASRVFGTFCIAYEQTVRDDSEGLSQQRERVGLGAGLRLALGPPVSLRLSAQGELEHLRVSIRQPMSGRGDAGSRVRVGVSGGAELSVAVAERFEAFGGLRAAAFDESTSVRVQGAAADVVPGWEASLALGLNARFP